jgi:preprotein translocase subunit YajC
VLRASLPALSENPEQTNQSTNLQSINQPITNIKTMILLFALQGASGLSSIFMMAAVLGVAYWFMIRPQMQREKEAQNYINTVEVGQQIVTSGGIYGKITRIEGEILHVQIDKMTNVRLDKSSVAVEKTRALSAAKAVENA